MNSSGFEPNRFETSRFDRFINFFRSSGPAEHPPAAVAQVVHIPAQQKIKKSKPIPIPQPVPRARPQDQNSIEELNSRMNRLALVKKEPEYDQILAKKLTDLGKKFHRLTEAEIFALADLISYDVLNIGKKSSKTEKRDAYTPRTVHFDFVNKYAVIQLKTKEKLPEYRSEKLRTTRAIVVKWQRNEVTDAVTFEAHRAFQHVTADTLNADEHKNYVLFESRIDPKDSWFFPKFFGSYDTKKGEIKKKSFITIGYERSLEDALAVSRVKSSDLLYVVLEILKALETLHEAEIVHGNLKQRSIFIDNDGNLHLAGYEYAKAFTQGEKWERATYGEEKYTAPELLEKKRIPPGQLPKMDLYALGMLIKEMTATFDPQDDYIQFLHSLKEQLTQKDPQERISAVAARLMIEDAISN